MIEISPVCPISSVWPSGGDDITACAPIDPVAPARFSTTTDCPSAVKNRPANGRVIFGDDYPDTSKTKTTDKVKLPPDVKGFTGVKPPTQLLPKRPPE